MEQGHVDLRDIEVFVLDEADRMLDMGFVRDGAEDHRPPAASDSAVAALLGHHAGRDRGSRLSGEISAPAGASVGGGAPGDDRSSASRRASTTSEAGDKTRRC